MEAMRNSVQQDEIEEIRRNHMKRTGASLKSLEVDVEAVTDMNSQYGTAGTERKIPYHALIKESLQLTDNEVTISFMKFMIGVAILNFPA